MKSVASLRRKDIEQHPVWRFTNRHEDAAEETVVEPVKRLPVRSLRGCVIGTQVTLNNGEKVWALISNIDVNNVKLNEHFVTLSLDHDDGWFHLARYHDFDHAERGPAALATALRRSVSEIFPIAYDLRRIVAGGPEAVKGEYPQEPTTRLTRAQVIALAVP